MKLTTTKKGIRKVSLTATANVSLKPDGKTQ